MTQLPSRRLVHLGIAGFVVAYAAVMAHAWFNQRAMMYHPQKNMKDPAAYGLAMAAMQDTTVDGVKITLWYRPATPGQPTFLFFHGNSGNLSGRADKFRQILEEKYGLLAVSYRGFGTSEGEPTEQGLYNDARAAMQWLGARGVAADQIILYGESLGTAVAVQMAKEFPKAQALVLEAPFTSMADVGQVHHPYLPVGLLLKDRFDSLSKVKDIHVPLLIVQGTEDEIVPVEEGKELLAAANEPKMGKFIPGFQHNNLDIKATMIYLKTFLAIARFQGVIQ